MAQQTKHGHVGSGADYARAVRNSITKLNPVYLARDNLVMFIVEVGFVIVLVMGILPSAFGGLVNQQPWFYFAIAGILLVTVWFSTLSEALSEAQGRARVDFLRSLEKDVQARRIVDGNESVVPSRSLLPGDLVRVSKGETIPRDGVIKEGKAYIDESMMTGESVPAFKETGNHVIGGTKVATDSILVTIVAEAGKSYLDEMIALVENAKRPKSPNEISLTVLLIGLTAIFILVVGTFLFLAQDVGTTMDLAILISLLVALMPTTIGGLLPAIGVAGITRVGKANVVAKSGKAVEAAGDVDTLILDKTGTITEGQRSVKEFVPVEGFTVEEVGQAAYLASIYDQTPEGRSAVEVAKKNGWVLPITARVLSGRAIEFSAETRVSGIELFVPKPEAILPAGGLPKPSPEVASSKVWAELVRLEGTAQPARIIKGAVDAILATGPEVNEAELRWKAQEISLTGGTPMAITVDRRVVGLVNLRDNLKPDIRKKLDAVRATGIKTVMVTGDNEVTAKVIAKEANIDEVMAQAKPADKLVKVEAEQKLRHIVGVEGDGTNDAPALAKADVGIAMNSGTAAAREAANMVDLDSDPSKILKVVEVGKQLLMTRGAITTFSVTNDIAKYFTLFPAILPGNWTAHLLNVMQLHSPVTAILATMIFNAIIIPILIPLSLKGVRFRAEATEKTFVRNMAIYGVGGAILPFVAIKGIDIVLALFIR
ncbi:MAG TPA: HAD-IC family P-type ATPase [Thermoplasmata archaeon]|nr:HAD-IC family P-type ATPase [Thermoplasmata archaeon]